jgi:hypothetical protein
MGMNFSTRPTGASASVSAVQRVGRAADRPVATELPAGESVAAVDAGTGVGDDSHSANDAPSNQTVLERSAAWFVDQVIDGRESLQPYTDEASERRRAYFQAQHLTRRKPSRPLTTDRKA